MKTVVPQAEVVPGETLKLRHTAIVTSDVPVRWVAVRYPAIKARMQIRKSIELRPNQPASRDDDANAARQHAAEPAVLAA